MLAAVKENMMEIDGVMQRVYAVEEVFDRIGYNLIEVFGEDSRKKLNKVRAKFGMAAL